jgi:Berberine and berberine like
LLKVIDVIIELANRAGSSLTDIVIQLFGGAMSRVGTGETAFAHRRVEYNIGIEAKWLDPAESGERIAWARNCSEALKPYSSNAYLLSFLGDESEDMVRAAFGDNYERLVALKTKYDPTNFFSLNQNVRPHR